MEHNKKLKLNKTGEQKSERSFSAVQDKNE